MYKTGHDIRRKSASILLVVYLLGGLLGPVVHWVHHGQTWAEHLAEAPAPSGDTPRSDGFAASGPDHHDDDCLLCDHQLHASVAQTSPDLSDHAYSGYLLPQRFAPDTPHFFYFSIRGPPPAA